jgi:hypothetical protein
MNAVRDIGDLIPIHDFQEAPPFKTESFTSLYSLINLTGSMLFSDPFKGSVHHHKRFRIDIEDNVFQLGQLGQRGNG